MFRLIYIGVFSFLVILVPIVAGHAASVSLKPNVSLNVGQSMIVTGVRNRECGGGAPSWSNIKSRLPRSKTGKFSNGGTGTLDSDSCGETVAVRAVRFTATKAGTEKVKVFGDRISITVK